MIHKARFSLIMFAACLLGARANAIVTVESFINQIEDIGVCDLANGINDKCGFTEVADLALITAFNDARGAHEVAGSVRFTAEQGQVGGFDAFDDVLCTGGLANFDNGDWDVPDRLFTCSEVVPLSGACTGIDNTTSSCFVSPDITGRLDSESCSDYFVGQYTAAGLASYGCRLSDFDDPNTDHEDYTFFNYLACNPTSDCFQADPIGDIGGACDQNGGGPFFVPADNLIAGDINDDIWVAGTVVSMRLPFGIRLGNTVYPGVMLNGTRQFDFNDAAFSPRINNTLNPSIPNREDIAWPAVIYSYEANHVTPTAAQLLGGMVPDCEDLSPDPEAHMAETAPQFGMWQPKICRGQYSGNDAILLFVPDILSNSYTTPILTSSFVIGESLYDGAKPDLGDVLPMSRNSVENCFKESVLCTPLVAPEANLNFCDYDTSVSLDIRGAYPAMRSYSPFDISRFVRYTLQAPLFSQTQFTVPDPVVARVTDRQTILPGIVNEPAQPYCTGENSCYCYDFDSSMICESDEVVQAAGSHVRVALNPLTIEEPSAGYFKVVDPAPATDFTDLYATKTSIHCELPSSDSQGFDVAAGADFYSPTGAMTDGCPELETPRFTGQGGLADATIMPLGNEMTLETPIWAQDGDGFTLQITSESSSGPASITISGLELAVDLTAEPFQGGDSGCFELHCMLRYQGPPPPTHEGLANTDASGDLHLPESNDYNTYPLEIPLFPLACIAPGSLLAGDDPRPECAFCHDDATCSDGDFCNGAETCDTTGLGIPGVTPGASGWGCQAGTPPVCDDSDPCNGLETCDSLDGCQPGAPCDDGDFCNGVETCNPLDGCMSGTPVDCNDFNGCTLDVCDPGTGTCDNIGYGNCIPAGNRVGNVDNDAFLDDTDLVQLHDHLLFNGMPENVSPLSLLDGDQDIDIADVMLLGQVLSTGRPDLEGPGSLFSVSNGGNFSTSNGAAPTLIYWSILSNLVGVAELNDGIEVEIEILPPNMTGSYLDSVSIAVSGGFATALFHPVNLSPMPIPLNIRLTIKTQDSDGSDITPFISSTVTALVGP